MILDGQPHGVAHDGYVIETEHKYKLLSKDAYKEVSSFMKPYLPSSYSQLHEARFMGVSPERTRSLLVQSGTVIP